jgi:hypothetical protein
MKRWLSVSFALGAFIGAVGVSAFTLLHLQFGPLNVPSAPVSAQPVSGVTTDAGRGSFAQAQAFLQEKGITLSSQPTASFTWAEWQPADPNDANTARAAAMLQTEWQKYRNGTLRAAGLQTIYLVRDLTVSGQARSGMPDPQFGDALYFDVSDTYLNSEGGAYLRRTFHHEFNHLIQFNLFGSYDPADSGWAGCNAASFEYGDGGAAMYADPGYAHKAHPSYAFIDGYATSAREEDKAEIFAYYMTDPGYLQKLADKDAGIACKVTQTEKLLRSL